MQKYGCTKKIYLHNGKNNCALYYNFNHKVNTHRKTYITPHHTQTSRSLCECDTQSSNYNKDTGMKSVMQQFDDRTSQRFEEYKERLKEKRHKRKEERDKNIQKIIEEDKREKSLEQKIERGCLRCGCALGGVAASVGIFGTIAVKELTKAAITAAEIAAKKAGSAAMVQAAEAGVQALIKGLQEMGISTLGRKELVSYFTAENYTNAVHINGLIQTEYNGTSCISLSSGSVPVTKEQFCTWWTQNFVRAKDITGKQLSANDFIKKAVEKIVSNAKGVAGDAADTATKEYIKASTIAAESTYASSQIAIIASVVTILVIVLVMIIIYLVLRYRRKRKMNKKAQYTKLLKA
nr:rifin PIR protein,putative [Plasmodium sp. DRC-Itaito]